MSYPALPVLTYHGIEDYRYPIFTPADVFESHLIALRRLGYRGITISEVAESLKNNTPLPEKSVAITFDDGYQSVATHALPRMRELGFIATVYLISDYMGKNNRWPGQPASLPGLPLMTWDQAADLAEQGWEMGAHTCTHAVLPFLSVKQMDEEIYRSQETIESALKLSVRSFAYPYGAFDPLVEMIVRTDFFSAVSTNLGLVGEHSNPYALERIDAFYITPQAIAELLTPGFRWFLGVRQTLRRARRMIRPDWQRPQMPESHAG